MQRVTDASASSLASVLAQAVASGIIVGTDELKRYNGLNRLSYPYEIMRKAIAVEDNFFTFCNKVAALVKRLLVGTHLGAVSHEHLDYYLDEYTFRFNRRASRFRGKLFCRLLQHAVATEPKIYDGFVQGSWVARRRNHNICSTYASQGDTPIILLFAGQYSCYLSLSCVP